MNNELKTDFPRHALDELQARYFKKVQGWYLNILKGLKDFHTDKTPLESLSDDELRNTQFYKAIISTHQYRIPFEIKRAAVYQLHKRIDELRILDDFEAIMDAVSEILTVAGIKGQPSLWTYDVSLRIANSRNDDRAMPTNYVYAYQHAYDSARILFRNNKPVPHKLPIEVMQPMFPKMQPHEIEQMLCVCYDKVEELAEKYCGIIIKKK